MFEWPQLNFTTFLLIETHLVGKNMRQRSILFEKQKIGCRDYQLFLNSSLTPYSLFCQSLYRCKWRQNIRCLTFLMFPFLCSLLIRKCFRHFYDDKKSLHPPSFILGVAKNKVCQSTLTWMVILIKLFLSLHSLSFSLPLSLCHSLFLYHFVFQAQKSLISYKIKILYYIFQELFIL